jgi:hypothetical protein
MLLPVLATSAVALGQTPTPELPPEIADDDAPTLEFRLDPAAVSYQADSDIDDGGEFSLLRASIGGGMLWRISDRFSYDSLLVYEYDDYDFSGSRGFGGLDPWEDVSTIRYIGQFNWQLDDTWTLVAAPIITIAAEDSSDFSNSLKLGGMIGAGRRWSDSLVASFGIVVIDQIDDDVDILPFILFDWTINEQWTLRTRRIDLGTTGGLALEGVWRFSEDWNAIFGIGYQKRRFRLDDEGVAPEGVGEHVQAPLFGKLVWKVNDNITADFFAGVAVGGELRLEDDGGHKISEEDFDPAPFFGAKVAIRF